MNSWQKENNSKNIIIVVLALLVLVLGYYSFSGGRIGAQPEVSTKEDDNTQSYFDRNQKCLSYKDEIAEKLEKKRVFDETSLEQIFYSPKLDSCLYVEYSSITGDVTKGEYAYYRRLFDILNDGPSSHPLADCYSSQLGDEEECNNFDRTIAGYKK